MKPDAGFRPTGNVCRWCVMILVLWAVPGWAMSAMPTQPPSLLVLKPVIPAGLEQPLFLTHAADGSGRLFVVEQGGRIRIVDQGRLLKEPFLDMASRLSSGGERGLLGLAFHPAYERNGRYFVNYTRAQDGATVIAEYRVSSTNRNRSDGEEKIVLTIPQPYGNHNGGMIAFGPDGYLYIGMGDGGAGGDPGNRAQNPQELLGKILRIDIDRGAPYAIPEGNMFLEENGRPEIWAMGFRNPWRFSFDRVTGQLWVADVGQNQWEEIDLVHPGDNHGWRIMEGKHCFRPKDGCSRQGLTPPVAEYDHQGSRCAVTGGYRYRGNHIPELKGTYVFGDYCSGEMMGLVQQDVQVLLSTNARISSFGEDEAGEVYLVDHQGAVYQIVRQDGMR